MPAQNRPVDTTAPPPSPPPPQPQEEEMAGDSLQGIENHNQEQSENNSDSDSSSYPSDGEKDEFIEVNLADILKEVQCPICLGIIRKTRTVMECLHRFCRECIDKSMRMGNNECPACRTHCASRRSLRDDPKYDSLIAALYPDIDKYEEEEFAFNEEEKACNKQIQASIAESFRQQAEAVGKKRTLATFSKTTQGNHRSLRVRREANGHDSNKNSSSTDERLTEVKLKEYETGANANAHVGSDDNSSETNR